MRLQAHLHDWNDQRGFGFVTPQGGERAFVHVKAFAIAGSRRPVNGELLTFELRRDEQGRLNAVQLRFQNQTPRVDSGAGNTQRRPVRVVLALVLLTVPGLAWLAGMIPSIVPLAYLLMSVLSFALYAIDKSAARRNARRVPEKNLYLLDVLCGWPGGLLAQGLLRHKSSKTAFQWVFWCTVLVNVSAVLWLRHEGLLAQLQKGVLG